MSRGYLLLSCALPALSPVLLASDGKSTAAFGEERTLDPAAEPGLPALFAWGDLDGDGRLDLAAVSAGGELQVLTCTPDGRFEDVTEQVGLSGVNGAALALWADYEGDGRLDLFVGAREGASRLFHNEGGLFVDMSAGAGLASEGAVQSAQWLDHDGDGRLDLFLATAEKGELVMRLFRGLEGGFFEVAELPLAGTLSVSGLASPLAATDGEDAGGSGTPPPQGSSGERGGSRTGRSSGGDASVGVANASGGRVARTPSPSGSSGASLPMLASCLLSLRDQANPNTCIQASTSPTLGKLYPISANLFVAAGGNVGVGTTSPTAKLHVAGTARMTDTLTLNPSGDTALDVSTGSIYKSGTLFIHTKGGVGNAAFGPQALASVTTGTVNTASGSEALRFDTTGSANTASGFAALQANTTGSNNTAIGTSALRANTTGYHNTATGTTALRLNTTGTYNTASGMRALFSNTTGNYNTADGARALDQNTTGTRNTASGFRALSSNTTGSYNTANGMRALSFNTTGSYNTASGARALYSNTIGTRNTASGHRALFSNTSGAYNTANGLGALAFNTTGSRNSATGYYALRSNTTGSYNTASGDKALFSNTTGNSNTASGMSALFSNKTGFRNTASGLFALRLNTYGHSNTASGAYALYSNTTGVYNTASGIGALGQNTTGNGNTASGSGALENNTSGSRNIAIGYRAGRLTLGSDNIDIGHEGDASDAGTIRMGTAGTHTRAFIAGIRGSVTGVANAIPVLIDSAGQLGTASSSRRFKKDIRDMGDATRWLLDLRPVLFRYKQEQTLPGGQEVPPEYGLIAEEVAEVFPDLVVYDEDGQPFTVKYHLLSSMLLNELKKQATLVEELRSEQARQRGEFEARLAAVESRSIAPPGSNVSDAGGH